MSYFRVCLPIIIFTVDNFSISHFYPSPLNVFSFTLLFPFTFSFLTYPLRFYIYIFNFLTFSFSFPSSQSMTSCPRFQCSLPPNLLHFISSSLCLPIFFFLLLTRCTPLPRLLPVPHSREPRKRCQGHESAVLEMGVVRQAKIRR